MKKIGYFFFCFLPLIVSISLQFIVCVPAMGFGAIQALLPHVLSGEKNSPDHLMQSVMTVWSSQDFSSLVSILFAAAAILVFGFWYLAQFHAPLRQGLRSLANPKLLLSLVLMVPALQLMSLLVTGIASNLFPGWMSFYEKLMESAGFTGEPTLLLILYAVILGPIEEELTFRGVILCSAERALPFWAANLLQAALFGVFHLNVIQGLYAFCIGLVLGYVCKRGGSIYLSIFLHILFNLWGTLAASEVFYSGFLTIAVIVIGILGFLLFSANAPAAKKAGEVFASSDI